jgi:hypothetical protein
MGTGLLMRFTVRYGGIFKQICRVMISIRSKIERDARRAVVARLVATRTCETAARTARRLLPELSVVGREGFATFVGKHGCSPEGLQKRLRDIAARGVHSCDTPAQAHVIETIFESAAHERTVALDAGVGLESRGAAREILALYLAEMMRSLLVALEEERARQRNILDLFRRSASGSGPSRAWPLAYASGRWNSLQQAPLLAVLHVSGASGNGPAGLISEFSAANRHVIEMTLLREPGSFIGALFYGGLCQRKLRQLADQQLSPAQLVASLQRTVATFDSVSLRERQAYRDVIAAAANAAAKAAQEQVIFSRGWQLEDEGCALEDIQRLIVCPATIRPAATSSLSA